jgi:hypothetical protein
MRTPIVRSFMACILVCLLYVTVNGQNNALQFDGIDDYVIVPAPVATGGSYTKEAWVYATATNSSRNIISSQNAPFWISNNILKAGQAGIYDYVYDPTPFPLNRWMHVAVTYDAATKTMKLYKNGIVVATNTNVPAYTAETMFIGSHAGTGSYFEGRIDEVKIWNVARTAAEIKEGMFGVPANSAGLRVYYKMNESSGTTLVNAAGVAGLDGTLKNGPSRVSSPIQQSRNALSFDGVNDQVVIPTNTAYDLTQGTIECWVKPGNLVGQACILGNRGSGGTRFSFHMSTTDNWIGFWNNKAYVTLPYAITPGQWYHLAFVCNGTSVTCYVNGVSIGVFFQTFSNVTGQPLHIGMAKVDGTGADLEPFRGEIDEIRIWNTARSSSQIINNKDIALTGNEPGLVALFGFDQGIAGSDNAGLTTVVDKSPNNNHGQLVNFALSGSTSNWTANGAITTLPVTLRGFSVYKQNQSARLQWQTASEQNSKEFIIERSNDGTIYNAIGAVAAAGNSQYVRQYAYTDEHPETGNNYYRLKQVDIDGKFSYSPVVRVAFAAAQKLGCGIVGNGTVYVILQSGANEPYIVTDINGRIVRRGQLSGGKAWLSQLTPGTYAVSIRGQEENYTATFIVP